MQHAAVRQHVVVELRRLEHIRHAPRGFGFPSSHAIVVFGAAAILARLFPRARVVWYAAAIGCAVSRLLAHAHYLSDVSGDTGRRAKPDRR